MQASSSRDCRCGRGDRIAFRDPGARGGRHLVGQQTALCGVVLHPAGHTRSPAMHNAAYAALGLDAVYLAFDVPTPRLRDALAGVRGLGVRQLSVSIPHKTSVLELVDEVDATAARIGAAITGGWRADRLVAS